MSILPNAPRPLFRAALLLGVAGAAIPVGLHARDPAPVDPAALVQSALACRGIPDEIGGAERRIVELGWPRKRQRSGETTLGFERDGMMLVLAPPDGQGHTLSCGVFARVRGSVSQADLMAAVSAALGRQPGPGDAGGFPVWELDGGQVVALITPERGAVVFNFWYPRTRAQ